ncbi:peptidase inhibitor family I36 protein [Actinomadura madurae]|uniref:peptidase inhibitor family I36 protein n=1 Tax=Actinomadura madurae TaxID=1993 RepID=UPI0020D210A9|nr:peptidase inhibitor family I36 protein [Actinomadura madurae]MCP9949727.1 peptidase inhibitor family I36 protein [Actinomadura madurae]MCP9966475.1 peptidase inhibitor family I36 protein [Actinomadura madurae]MCP9978965.1 peptidase inhibitor family I36 protein [Actinomadura madurae]MCQ0009511.1 peptidase inhibitor family I36 protein [Actinomadura madurae]MCQ0015149.1 peptidase inhibitor family I36 protein [Actinomadura madurae]
MSMRKLGAKATVAALAAAALLGTAPAEAGALAKQETPWRKAPIFGPSCPAWNVCIWTEPNYGNQGVRFSARTTVYPCQGVRFEGTGFQNQMLSFKNYTSGYISFWNRYADGSYNYGRLGTFAPGPGNEIYDFTNGRLADAFVYDPRGDCKILTLDHIADVGATRSTVVLKVDPGGGTARAVA